ncbi:MAG: HIT domain-containing protein [Deltaproteobacteria bacterium]|nr:HIT domain-containing protein [Deltaproteobacteria bacterium]
MSDQRIWAPWRLEYILEHVADKSKKAKGACVFCEAQKGRASQKNLVLYRGQHAYIIMNKYPYANAHLMVIPNRHLSDFSKLTSEEHQEMGELLSLCTKVLKKIAKPHGFNIGMNLGEAAGAGIKEHLHYHIVPRWSGDHNFMPVVANLRVMMEHIKKTYIKLKTEFDLV